MAEKDEARRRDTARKRRERTYREEKNAEWDNFDKLSGRIVRVPKRDIDEKRHRGGADA